MVTKYNKTYYEYYLKSLSSILNSQGSTLIGVALLTLVMGFLMSGGIYLLNTYNSVQTKIETEDKTRSLQDAIQNFVDIHKRYPCPARIDLAPDASGFGQEDCAIDDVSGRDGLDVLIGTVPVRTLNVPDSNIVDGYGRRYIYAVTTDRTAIDGTADVVNSMGAITILHSVNGHEETLSNEAGFVVYALMSSGADDRGAYDINGNEISPCVEGTIAGENCDFDDAVFKTTIVSTTAADTDFSHKFAFVAKGPAFYWHTGPWSECGRKYTMGNPTDQSLWSGSGTDNRSAYGHTAATPICDASHQERLVECRKKQGSNTDVVDTNCNHTPRPVSLRACAIAPCKWVQRAPTCRGEPELEPVDRCELTELPERTRVESCADGQAGEITIRERQIPASWDPSGTVSYGGLDCYDGVEMGPWREIDREENCTIEDVVITVRVTYFPQEGVNCDKDITTPPDDKSNRRYEQACKDHIEGLTGQKGRDKYTLLSRKSYINPRSTSFATSYVCKAKVRCH